MTIEKSSYWPRWAHLLIYTKGPGPEADAAWTKALKIAETLGDTDYQVRALWGLWSSHFQQRQVPAVSEYCGNSCAKWRPTPETPPPRSWATEALGCRYFIWAIIPMHDIIPNPCFANMSGPEIGHTSFDFNFDPRLVSRTLLAKLLWAQGFPDQAMREVDGVIEEA